MNGIRIIICIGLGVFFSLSTYSTFIGSKIQAIGQNLIIKFPKKAADDLKCIGLILKPLEVHDEGPRIFYVNCESVIKCGYRGNPYKKSCKVDFMQDIEGYYTCLSENDVMGEPTACTHKRIRCQQICPDIYFDLWESQPNDMISNLIEDFWDKELLNNTVG